MINIEGLDEFKAIHEEVAEVKMVMVDQRGRHIDAAKTLNNLSKAVVKLNSNNLILADALRVCRMQINRLETELREERRRRK